MGEFDQRIVLVTGANGGLGTAVTAAFLQAGATVFGVYHAGAPPAPGHSRFTPIQADLTDPAEAARVVGRLPRLDALVHLVPWRARTTPPGAACWT